MRYHEIISENNDIFYRGLMQAWSTDHSVSQHIIFVTSNKEYAATYAKDEQHIMSFTVDLGKSFDFGFRTLTTEVKLADVTYRIKRGVLNQFNDNQISQSLGLQLIYKLAKLNMAGYNPVYEWYMTIPELTNILKQAGYDSIKCMEGPNNNITTYGVFSNSQLTII